MMMLMMLMMMMMMMTSFSSYDEAAAAFITNATKHSIPFFWYFASHHTHVPQFSGVDRNGYTLRGLQGDSLSLLDRSVEKMLDLFISLDVADTTLTIFSADNGGARYWGPDVGGVNGELACGKTTTWEGGFRVPTIVHWYGRQAHYPTGFYFNFS